MELCSLLGIVVDINLCLAHRFFAVMENSCVQYPEMPYTTVTRIGKFNGFFFTFEKYYCVNLCFESQVQKIVCNLGFFLVGVLVLLCYVIVICFACHSYC